MADQRIDGALFQSMVIEGALAIAEKKEQVNELNVFPVPDGDIFLLPPFLSPAFLKSVSFSALFHS